MTDYPSSAADACDIYPGTASACNYYPHVILMDMAYLASNVYHDPASMKYLGTLPRVAPAINVLTKAIRDNKQGWYQIQTPELHLPLGDGFYADLYVKLSQRRKIYAVTIAVRGTDNRDNVIVDIETWGKSVIDNPHASIPMPAYFPQLLTFSHKVNDVIKQLKKEELLDSLCQFHVTGHSLGGALANLLVAFAPHKGFRSVSFNPPGIASIHGVNKSPILQDRVITVRATYDFVSAVGEPYGYVINTHVPQHYAEAKKVFEIARKLKNQSGNPFWWFEKYGVLKQIQKQLKKPIDQGTEGVDFAISVKTTT